MRFRLVGALLVMALVVAAPASASLTTFQNFVGNYGVSTDGFGSTSQTGQIQASVPVGATVVGAYLYTSTFSNPSLSGVNGTTFNGNVVSFTNLGVNSSSCCALAAGRTDVTSIVAGVVNGGPGGTYNFNIAESDGSQDGEALVVVYQLAALPTTTIGILDGFSQSSGDDATISFANPLASSDPGFFAEMLIGDGFSCCSQMSSITVNGTVITESAGNNDDGDAVANGALITVGGFDDPFSPLLPSYTDDHERYNLVPQIADGSTNILIHTLNPSNDDNIFLEVFRVLGEGQVSTGPVAPEPATLTLVGLGALAALRRRRQSL